MLTPLARGCSMLVAGPQAAEQSAFMLDILANQATAGVHVVYAAAGAAQETVSASVDRLRASGALARGTVVAAGPDAPLGEQYAALCAAVALGEAIRDRGGHAVVALDSMECAVQLWDSITREVTRRRGSSTGARPARLGLRVPHTLCRMRSSLPAHEL